MTDDEKRALANKELEEGTAGLRINFTDSATGEIKSVSFEEAQKMGFNSDVLSQTIPYYKVGNTFSPKEPTTATVSLNKVTGNIKVTAPKSVTEDEDFKSQLEIFKTYSSNYKMNPNAQYIQKNSDGTTESVTLDEFIDRLNTPVDTGQKDKDGKPIKISPFQTQVNQYIYNGQVREMIGPQYRQIDEAGNITPVHLDSTDIVRMSTNGLGADVTDTTRLAIPKGIEAFKDIYADEDWDDGLSTISVKKFKELWYDRKKTNSQAILTAYGDIGRYLADAKRNPTNVENVDTEKWTAAYALYTFLSEADPTCSMFRKAWDALGAVVNAAGQAATNYTILGAEAVSGVAEKVADLTLNLYESGLSADPFRDNPSTNFTTWAKTTKEVMDVKWFAQSWGFGIGEFEKAANVKYDLDSTREELKGLLGVGVDKETAARFATEGATPQLNSAADAIRKVGTSLIQLGVAIHVGNVLSDAATAGVERTAKALVEGAETIESMVAAGTKAWVAIEGAEGTAKILNLVSKMMMTPVPVLGIGLVGESIGEALFQSPEVLAQILQSDTLEPEAQQYLWDTYLGNAVGLAVGTGIAKGAQQIGNTAWGKAVSRNWQNWLWKAQAKLGDTVDGIRVKLSGSADVKEWLDKIGSKGLNEASHNNYVRKEMIMAQQRTLRRARQAIAERSPKIKWIGESSESILKQIDEADEAINMFMKYENILDDVARGNIYRKLQILEDNPLLDASQTKLQQISGEIAELQVSAGLKAADKVGKLELFAPEVKRYISAKIRTDIGESIIAAKKTSKAVNALEGVEQIEKELAHWSGVISNFEKTYGRDLVAKANEFIGETKNWWARFNDFQVRNDLIDPEDLIKWRESGEWGLNGELYARQQRVQELNDYVIRRRDGKLTKELTRNMGHYNWGSTEEFVDPMLVMQQEMEIAAERLNRIQAERTYSQITGTATVLKSAEDVRVATEARPYLKAYNNEVHQNIKPLVAEMDTDGLFAESIKRHSLSQEAKTAEAEARVIERTTLSRRTPTMGEMQTTVAKLDDNAIEELWESTYNGRTLNEVLQTQGQESTAVTLFRGQTSDGGLVLNQADKVSETVGRGFYTTADRQYASAFGNNVLNFNVEPSDILTRSELDELVADASKKVGDNKYMEALYQTNPEQAELLEEVALGRYEAAARLSGKSVVETTNDSTKPIIRQPKVGKTASRGATEYVYYPGISTRLDERISNQLNGTAPEVSSIERKRQLLMADSKTRTVPYMKNQVMAARQMEYDAIMRDGYSEAAERAAIASAEVGAQEELVNEIGSQTLDSFSETFFAKGSNANKVADEIMRRYGGDAPEAVGEYLYYDALKKNKASLAREVKAKAKKAFENYEVEVDGKATHPYKKNAEYLANRVSKNISDQVEVRFNSSRVAIANMGGDAAKLIDHDSWQREIYEVANEISELQKGDNILMIPNANGQNELVQVDPLLSIFVNSSTQYTPMGALGRANYLWMRLFRLGTTGLNPSSWVNQYFRDLGNAWVMGNVTQTLGSAVEELTEVFGRDAATILTQYSQEVQDNLMKLAQEQEKSIARVMAEREIRRGALYAQASTESEMTRLWRGTRSQWFTDPKGRGLYDKSMDAFDAVEEKVTIPNEVREKYLRNLVYGNNFNAAIKGGKSIEQARIFAEYIASNATTNFTRGVAFMSQFQNTIPYFRAAINGTRSFYRLWSLDPVGVTGRIVGGLIIPAFALTMSSLSTEENRKAYAKIQAYQKEDSLPIVMNGEAFFIPLPQELSAFIAPFRQAAESIQGLGYNNGLEVIMSDLLALSPVDFGGFTDIDSWRIYGEAPDWGERLTRGGAQVFSQIMPKWAVAAATAASGRDLYTGNKINTSYITVDPDTGEERVMSYTAGVLATALNKVFPNMPAPIAQEALENIFGTAGVQVIDFLADIVGQTASGQFNYLEAGENFLGEVASDLTKPIRPYIEARESADWRHAMSDLWDMKNDILSPSTPQGRAWQSMLTNKRNATTQTERDAVATARANILDPFYKQAMSAVKQLIKANPAAFTDYKLGSVISLFNFGSVGDTVNNAASDYAQDIYKQSKYAAVETMVRLGFPNVNQPSVLGTITKSQSTGETYIKWNTPLEILDMENTIYARGAIYAADIERLLKNNGITSQAMSDARDTYYATNDKNKRKEIAVEWAIKVATAIAPYVQQYGAESISSSNDVIDFLDGYLIIPYDYMKYNGKSTYNPKVDIARGYSKQFIKDVFGAKK